MTESPPDNPAPERLCLLRLSAIGDVTHMLPVVHTLQTHWPDTQLTWIVGSFEATLVGDLPGVEVIPWDKHGGVRAWRQLRRQLGRRRFDVLLQMQTALRASFAGLAVLARYRLGFDLARSRDGHILFTDRRVPPHPRAHVLDGFFDFPVALGVEERVMSWDVPLSDDDQAFAADALPGDGPALAVNPCSSVRPRNYRNWLPDRYAAVADHAAREHGCRVVFTGGPSAGEREFTDAVVHHMNAEPIDLVGRTSLKQLLAVYRRCSALVAPDTGPAHIGTAAGIPVIGLYATSNPLRTGPYNSLQWTVNRYPENLERYCGRTVEQVPWGKRVRHEEAMASITVKDVIERVDAVMVGRETEQGARNEVGKD